VCGRSVYVVCVLFVCVCGACGMYVHVCCTCVCCVCCRWCECVYCVWYVLGHEEWNHLLGKQTDFPFVLTGLGALPSQVTGS
jgi:hypothetical protein